MSLIYTRRKRSQSFGSYGSFNDQLAAEKLGSSPKPELIEGYAHICFNEDSNCFRGILLTADGTSYNISAKRTRIGLTEENQDNCDGADDMPSPDVMRDFPSPLRSALNSTDVAFVSRQSSLDARAAGELQFILEEIPSSTGVNINGDKCSPPSHCSSQSVSRPGSPPTTQQIIRALDNLLIRHSNGSLSEKSPMDEVCGSPISSPFRSRSGSRSGNRPQQTIEVISVVFDIAVSDLEDGTQHNIRNVSGRLGANFTLRNRQLCFATERTYWYFLFIVLTIKYYDYAINPVVLLLKGPTS